MQIYLIKVDNQIFSILEQTLFKYQESLLYRAINGEQCDFLIVDKNIISADIDIDSLAFIINYMRGYPYYNLAEPLLSKVYYDADRLNIQSLLNKIKNQIETSELSEIEYMNKYINNLQKKDTSSVPLDLSISDQKRNPKIIRPKKISLNL